MWHTSQKMTASLEPARHCGLVLATSRRYVMCVVSHPPPPQPHIRFPWGNCQAIRHAVQLHLSVAMARYRESESWVRLAFLDPPQALNSLTRCIKDRFPSHGSYFWHIVGSPWLVCWRANNLACRLEACRPELVGPSAKIRLFAYCSGALGQSHFDQASWKNEVKGPLLTEMYEHEGSRYSTSEDL
jgi:hypothetical protein